MPRGAPLAELANERIGDLLLSFANSAQAAAARLDPQDTRDLTQMATILEKMLADAGGAADRRLLQGAGRGPAG